MSNKTVKINLILLIVLASTALITGCGGGGGGAGSNACNVTKGLKIAGGESCGNGSSNVALLVLADGAGNATYCTGSYISLTSVLTAGHCFEGRPVAINIYTNNETRTAVSAQINPLYDGSIDSPFDMAIIKVNQPISSSPLPILVSSSPVIGDQVVAYGYGGDQRGQQAIDRIISGETALKAVFTTFAGYVGGTSTILSTGAGSTCAGDSGGPVLAKNASGAYGIIGITRAGPQGCNAEEGRPSDLSSTESKGAADFILANVPDVATN